MKDIGANIKDKPEGIYHFIASRHLVDILRSGCIGLTESNLNIAEWNCGVVWLATFFASLNHGLKFDANVPSEIDKTTVRITIRYKSEFERWDGWSDKKGMDRELKTSLDLF
jgi:hypothetical protein